MQYKKVLICIDNSELTVKVAEQGLRLSLQIGANVAIVFVVDTTKVNMDYETGNFPEHQIVKLKKEASATLDRITKKFPAILFDKYMPEGKPSEEIVKIANRWEANLIVMGTHGKTGLKRLLLGSTAEHTLRSSNIPILMIPA